jgi:hypothetical protein
MFVNFDGFLSLRLFNGIVGFLQFCSLKSYRFRQRNKKRRIGVDLQCLRIIRGTQAGQRTPHLFEFKCGLITRDFLLRLECLPPQAHRTGLHAFKDAVQPDRKE